MILKDLPKDYPKRILMLVPHEPDLDPRVDWVIKLCSEIGRTDVLGYTSKTQKPLREYYQQVYIERVLYEQYNSRSLRFLNKMVFFLLNPKELLSRVLYLIQHMDLIVDLLPGGKEITNRVKALKRRIGRAPTMDRGITSLPDDNMGIPVPKEKHIMPSVAKHPCTGKVDNSLAKWIQSVWGGFYSHMVISNTLFQRARASSVVPKVIVCHDIQALEAGVKLKKIFNSCLLYDSHELWVEANLMATSLEKRFIKSREQKLIRHADVVITVTPQIADFLEKTYAVRNVLTVPNAEPFVASSFSDNEIALPINFLLQGRAVPGRGIEEFLEIWNHLDDPRALLILRSPETPFLTCLQRRFEHLIDQGRIVIAQPVKEADLIRAAQSADVGIIPYTGPNLNHVYACPNKLSQYMQAGLAILHNSDQQFVATVVNRHACGASYNILSPNSLLGVVRSFIENPELVRKMKRNSYLGAKAEFNWEVQSKVYTQAIKQLFEKS